MRILLVNTNQVLPPIPPIGLLQLGAYLREKGHETAICDLCLEEDITARLKEDIEGLRPHVVGVTIRNIDNVTFYASCEYLPFVKEVMGVIRACHDGPVVLGGAGYSIMPGEILAWLGADFGIAGEGELALEELLQALDAPRAYPRIRGLVYRQKGRVTVNPPRHIPSGALNSLPFQQIDLVDYKRYFACGGYASVSTARGCAMECNYCTYPIIEGKLFRPKSGRRVADEIEMFLAQGYDYFNFTDSVFNFSPGHVREICGEIKKRGLKFSWNAYLTPAGLAPEIVELMLETGCRGFYVGVDTCSEQMLPRMGKGFAKREIVRAAANLHKASCDFGFWLLLGSAGESRETLLETFSLIEAIDPVFTPIMYGIRVYPNTPLAREAVREGSLRADTDWLSPQFYISPRVKDCIEEMVGDFVRAKSNRWAPLKGGEFTINRELMELYKKGVKGPPWRMAQELERLRSAKTGLKKDSAPRRQN